MSRKLRIIRDIILPAFLLLPLLLFLTGCLYIPWFEHRLDASHANPRALIGPANSGQPIRPGAITRSEVESLLGPPAYATFNYRSEVFIERSGYGFWFAPLCFATAPADEKVYAVRLDYDEHGKLISYDWAGVFNPLMYRYNATGEAVKKLTKPGMTLQPIYELQGGR